jgi:hypothetical protein
MHHHDEPDDDGRQLPLFARPHPRPRREKPTGPAMITTPAGAEEFGEEPGNEAQDDLFAAPTLLRGEIERAIAAADFDEAARKRDELATEHGSSWIPRDLQFLDGLIPCPWDPPDLAALLAGWRRAKPLMATPGRCQQVANGLFGRLAALRLEHDVVQCDASCLTDILRAMWRGGRHDDARVFLRDALLRGEEPDPDAIDDDVIRDVLREPRSPRWLASFGALRGAWKAPRMNAHELMLWEQSLMAPLPAEDADRAGACWDCIRVAAMRGSVPEDLVHAARRQRKALEAGL